MTEGFHSLFEAMPDAPVQGYDAQRRVIYWNRASERLYGYTAEEALGRRLEDLIIPQNMRRQVIQDVDNWVGGGIPVPTGKLILRRKDGSAVTVFSSHAMEMGQNGPEMYCIDIDLSGKSQGTRLEQRERRHTAILTAIVMGTPLQQILADIVRSVELENPTMRCSVLLVSEDGQHLYTGAAPSLPDFYNQAVNGIRIDEGSGSCGTAAFRRQRVITADIRIHPAWVAFRTVAEQAGLRACWSEPVLDRDGQVLATFAMYHDDPITPTADDLDTIRTAASLTSLAIERVRQEAHLHRRTELEELIRRISTHFLTLNMDAVDEGVNWALQCLGEFTHTNRCYLLLLSEDGATLSNTHEWCAAGVESRQHDLQHIRCSDLPWTMACIGRLETCMITKSDRAKLSAGEREFLAAEAVASVFGVPIVHSGQLHGLLGFDDIHRERDWPEPERRLLQVAAGIIGSTLARKTLEMRLHYEANHDALTGTFNRRWFLNVLDQHIEQAERYHRVFALILFDIDYFKLVNDRHGHDVGDQVLCQLVKLIVQRIRAADVLARWGGEEFVLLLPETALVGASETAESLRRSVAATDFGIPECITMSLGITHYQTSDDAKQLIKRADQALYTAKAQGRNCIVIGDTAC